MPVGGPVLRMTCCQLCTAGVVSNLRVQLVKRCALVWSCTSRTKAAALQMVGWRLHGSCQQLQGCCLGVPVCGWFNNHLQHAQARRLAPTLRCVKLSYCERCLLSSFTHSVLS